ncbi:MAG: GAF domain-containing protein [Chloroflexi bacterium]|nr:GAF domain-containing protein [Chloroflexota bacterium]
MVEVYLIVIGLIFLAWLYALVRQTRQGLAAGQNAVPRPIVPVNLTDGDEAIVVAEGRGRVVYINDLARNWFGMNGGAPNLNLMAQMIQPPDTLHDLLAGTGHASFRLGQRRIEAVSHAIPGGDGQRMVVVMREVNAAAAQSYLDFDPVRALSVMADVGQATVAAQDLDSAADLILRHVGQAVPFDRAELTLWQPETQTLKPLGRAQHAFKTGLLNSPEKEAETAYPLDEGYGGWIALYRQPLLISDVSARSDVLPRAVDADVQSYVGVPLMIGDRFTGTLELNSRQPNAFSQGDVSLLQAVSGQVAAALEAARLYQEQATHVAELSGLQQIAEAMSQLGEPSELYGQLTQRIAHLMGVELCGVLLYQEDEQNFRSQPPFYGVPDSLVQPYRLSISEASPLYPIWRHQAWWFSNDPESPVVRALALDEVLSAIDLNALALAPMFAGARRIGMLLIANKRSRQGFDEDDMRVLMSFASQAGVVVENARLYTDEQRRTRELGGLQQIAQAMGAVRSPADLYGQITTRIADLMGVEMCGVLLYHQKAQVLASQAPFYGMDDEVSINFYQLPSAPGSPVWELWQERNYWYSNNVRRDPAVGQTDLAQLATAVGIRQTVIAPLVVGGTRLGIIQASNKLDGTDFTEDDARILSIFAGQAAVLIDHARLYREMQRRTHEAEGLRAVTEIASQAAPADEMVEQVIVAIANLLEAQVVAIGLINEETGELVIDPGDVLGVTLPEPYRIDTYAPGFDRSVLVTRRPFVSDDLRGDTDLLAQYHALVRLAGLRSAIIVPLMVQDRSIGELLVANRTGGEPFGDSDAQLLTAIATQVAAMIDRMRLYQATDQDLRTRLQELAALGRVSHELSQTIELGRILEVLRHEALRSTAASATSIVLLADRVDWPAPDQPVIEQRFGENDALSELAPIERAAVLRGDVVLAANYEHSEFEPMPRKARSALAVPVQFGEDVVGLIHFYGERPDIFEARVVDFVLALSDQAAIAIGNARRYQEQINANRQLRIRAERMGRIFELGELFRRGASLPEMLEEVAHSVQETVGFNVVLISLVDAREQVLRRTAQAGLPLAVFEETQKVTPPVEQAYHLMQDAYRISNSYFLPAEGTSDLVAGLPTYQVMEHQLGTGPRAWHPDDLLLVPFYGSGGQMLGLMSVDEPRAGRRPDLATVEALEIFANQAAFSIENFRLIERIQQEAEATRRERDRLAQLHLVASEIQRAQDVPSRLQVVADGIHEAGWGRVVITLRDEHLEPTALIQAGYGPEEALELSDQVLPGRVWRQWINDLSFYDLKLGAGYYLRYDHPWVRQHALKDRDIEPAEVGLDEWHPLDAFYLPLVGQDQKRIIGIIEMYDPVEGRIPTEASLQPFELFASQAAAAIETTRLYLETMRAAAQEQRLNEMMEAVSRSLDRTAVIEAIGSDLQQMVPFTRMSVTLHDEQTGHFNRLRAMLAPDGTVRVVEDEPESLENTAMGRVFHEAEPRLFRLQHEEALRQRYLDLQAWYDSGERSTLIVPMIAGGQTIGTLHLGSELENAFGFQENLDLIQRLANLSAVALDNARLFQQARERATVLDEQARRLAFLNRVSAQFAQTLDPHEVYRIVLTELQGALNLQSAGLVLIQDEETSRLVLSTHPLDPPIPDLIIPIKGNPAAETVLETRQPLVASNLLADPRFEAMHEISRLRNTEAMLIVPVIMGGRVIGTIGLDSSTPREFTDAEIELALTTANQAALAIEKSRLFAEAQQRATELDDQAQRLAVINRVSIRLAQTLDPNEIYRIVLSELGENLGVQHAGLVLFENETTGRLMLDYPFVEPTPNLTLDLRDNASIQYVRETRKPLVSEDVLHDPLFQQAWTNLRLRGTKSLMIVPVTAAGAVIGTIGLDSTDLRRFTEAEIELAETIASQASLAMEKARLYNETLELTIFNQAVVESIQQGIVVLDRDLRVRRVNRYMTERYGWSIAAVGQALFEYRPDYGSFLRESVAVALGVGEPQTCDEIERLDPQGRRSIRNYYVYPMLEGRTVTGIVLLVEDVTARALLEADLNTRAVQMSALSEVSSQITATLEPDQVIDLILDALDQVVPFDGVSLWLRATDRDELYIAAARGYHDPDSPDADELIGLTVEIPFSPLFREMSDRARVIRVGDVGAGDPRFPYGSAATYKNWLGAPLISKGRVVGVVALEKREPNFYTELHEQLALTFANQAAVALDNAQLFEETRERARALDEQAQRLALLNRVSLALAQSLDLENIFEIALRETAITLGIEEGSAMQIDNPNQLGHVVVEYPRGDAPPQQVFVLTQNEVVARVQRNLIPLVVERSESDPLWPELEPMVRRDNVQSALLVPLVVGGTVIGLLRLDSLDERREFTTEQIELAQTIASQAAIAVQNAALFEQTSNRTRELETLFESAQATAVTLDLNEVVRRVTMQFLSALRADACTVFLWDDVNNRLEVRDDISARPTNVSLQAGDLFNLADYPLREQALRERELDILRADDPDLPPGEARVMAQHQAASRVLIPLVVNEISIGLVEVEILDPNRYFKTEDARLARTLASQAAISIENARLQTETRRTVEELYIINDMSAALSSASSLDDLLLEVDAQLPSLTDAQGIYVALYDSATDTLSFPLASFLDERHDLPPRSLGQDEFSLIIRRRMPLLLAGENLVDVRRSLGIESVLEPHGSFAGVPLFAGDEVIGALAVRDDDDPMAFSHNDQRILSTISSQLGVAIQSARLLQQTLQQAEELEQRVRERTAELEQERQHISTLYAITTELSTSLDVDRLLNSALEMVAQSVSATRGAILTLDPGGDRLNFRARLNWPAGNGRNGAGESLLTSEGLAGWAIQSRETLIVDDVQQDSRWLRLTATDDQARAALVALIEGSEGILGVMMLFSEQVGAFHADDLRLVSAAARQVATALNNAELYTMIRDQAERLATMLRQEQVEATKSSAILESVADGVMVSDPGGRVIVFNRTAERILGLAAEQVLGQQASAFAGLYGAGASSWADRMDRWTNQAADVQPGEFMEERINLEDGRVISVRLSPVHMAGQFLGTVSVFRDISREVEVDRLKSEFVATVSHELRTPMTSIKGYADLLLLGAAGEVSEPQQRFLETIKQNADRLSVLVNDLLDISRIDQGRVELRFSEINVVDVLGGVLEHLRGRSEDRKRPMNVTLDVPEGEPLTLWADYDKLTQIVTNLAENAFNYTPENGTVTLAASFSTDRKKMIIRVADTGVGIPPEVAGRVYERFFRGDETHELVMDTPGTGLGLSIVREFVQMHGGRIWFESQVGHGTTFYVELPVSAPEAASSPQVEAQTE